MEEKLTECMSNVMSEMDIGYDHSVYKEALIIEFEDNNISFETDVKIRLSYKNKQVGEIVADFFIDKSAIVALRICDKISRKTFNELERLKELLNVNEAYIINITSKNWNIVTV
jgi:GxxExxY protein